MKPPAIQVLFVTLTLGGVFPGCRLHNIHISTEKKEAMKDASFLDKKDLATLLRL